MLKKIYAEALTTINAAKYCILIVVIVYVGASVTGWLYHNDLPFFKESVNQLIEGFKDKNTVTFISKLMMRNLFAVYLTTCIFSFWGLIPAVATTTNGLLLGWIIASISGISYSKIAVLLIPHGVLELPAAFIGWGVGIWKGFGYRFTSKTTNYKMRFIKANIVYFSVIVPLLIIAAIIEGRYHIYKDFF